MNKYSLIPNGKPYNKLVINFSQKTIKSHSSNLENISKQKCVQSSICNHTVHKEISEQNRTDMIPGFQVHTSIKDR